MQEILNLIETQKKVFNDMMTDHNKDDFYRGVIAGLDLVKAYAEIRLKHEVKHD